MENRKIDTLPEDNSLPPEHPPASGLHSGVVRRALLVALVVGTALIAINQGDALAAGKPLDILKAALTYVIPFAVSLHGALTAAKA